MTAWIDAERERQRRARRLAGGLNAGFGLVFTVVFFLAFLLRVWDPAFAFFMLSYSLLWTVGGIAFVLGHRWSRFVLWPTSVLILGALPVGTLLGVYTMLALYTTRDWTD